MHSFHAKTQLNPKQMYTVATLMSMQEFLYESTNSDSIKMEYKMQLAKSIQSN